MPRIHNSDSTFNIMRYAKKLLKQTGRDFHTCELCGATSEKEMDIHHPFYVGCTLKDLQIVCRKCNTKAENKGLI